MTTNIQRFGCSQARRHSPGVRYLDPCPNRLLTTCQWREPRSSTEMPFCCVFASLFINKGRNPYPNNPPGAACSTPTPRRPRCFVHGRKQGQSRANPLSHTGAGLLRLAVLGHTDANATLTTRHRGVRQKRFLTKSRTARDKRAYEK